MPNGVMRLVPDDTRIPFMAFRNHAFAFSLLLSLASAMLFVAMDMNYGTDLRGGSSIEVQAKDPESARALRNPNYRGDVQP
jgi:SecD/SecF fusion protein